MWSALFTVMNQVVLITKGIAGNYTVYDENNTEYVSSAPTSYNSMVVDGGDCSHLVGRGRILQPTAAKVKSS